MKKNAIKKRAAQKEMVRIMSAAAESCARAIDNVAVPVKDGQDISVMVAICLELIDRTDPREFMDAVNTVQQRMKYFDKNKEAILGDMDAEEDDTANNVEG